MRCSDVSLRKSAAHLAREEGELTTEVEGTHARKKVLVVTSGGGHWEQMMLLRDALSACNPVYATTVPGMAERSGIVGAHLIADCNRHRPLATLRCVVDVWRLVWRERPDLVITTGAAPGLIALAIGKLHGKKAVWIDSVANSEKLSMSGAMAGWFADLQVTQWQHLAHTGGPDYMGSLL
jgi:hypothetical protein